MEYDPKLYVARGVPRISSTYMFNVVGDLKGPNLESLEPGQHIEEEPFIFEPIVQRTLILKNNNSLNHLSDEDRLYLGVRERLLQGALIRAHLIYASNSGVELSNKTGLPIPTYESAGAFTEQYLIKNIFNGGSDYLIGDLVEQDFNLGFLLARDHVPIEINPSERRRDFIIRMGLLGCGEVLDHLTKQNEIYRLEEQFRA